MSQLAQCIADWEVGENVNHWTRTVDGKKHLSIRATHPEMERGVHIAPSEQWVVETYPNDLWPFFGDGESEVTRFSLESEEATRRTVLTLIIMESAMRAKNLK